MQYRKKPVVVEAMQCKLGESKQKAIDFLEGNGELNEGEVYIKTLEGKMHVSLGGYIIKGVQGEFYPCKPDIFEQTYELAE